MQTILGSSGVIGRELANSLTQYTNNIRLVSRKPNKVNKIDELFKADLTSAEQTIKAVEGSEVVYLTAGFQYDIKIWQTQWPVVMKNVIEACKNSSSKLVFFDNVYSLGKVDGWMTEETPIKPDSEKGKVRAKISQMILEEVEKGNLQAIIARSADFYGPATPLSFVNIMVFDNFKKGKKAQWLINENKKHSLTYTPDAGKGTAILGNTDSAYNQVWHLPTNKNALTGKEFINLAAKAMELKPDYMIVKKWMVTMLGFFIKIIKESNEMLYQNEFDYLFDSNKFEKAFNFEPTSYEEGIVETVNSMK
ncbi:MAG: NAD-dependent epimerase/dehydratase family protein [Ignavibacteria bacterium]|nr:NAD-dependent epimerase/dehydratase family protein [Ignavibacteria bacterium]MBT8381823.1 NAD-dependent epimerase/dehydratase family protein [Ignavibacteria bacterium]MBT8392499.1 NAD-dependent epimerase/dehydratase family protein [Ignavibacteria bacterium]NNJ53576.1 NAD-dependent epimerase/dehydratase family protein [Ignavibacteriaceae bacterium]NNL22078.1 NAD-dependent epimerase/dehydratase family protein [Ignavibacteriaceae bacterium]